MVQRTRKDSSSDLGLISWRKLGGGSFTFQGKKVKPGETFLARPSDIPLSFRDLVVPADGAAWESVEGSSAFRPIEPIWDDSEPVFLLGGGPSVLDVFGIPVTARQDVIAGERTLSSMSEYLAPLHGKRVLAINDLYALGDWVTAMYFGDNTFYNVHRKALTEYGGFVYGSLSQDAPGVRAVAKAERMNGLSSDPSEVCWNHNSGLAAINLAYHLGAREVVLVGYDMKAGPNGETHWYRQAERPAPYLLFMQGMADIARDADKMGLKISVMGDSALTQFPHWKGSIKKVSKRGTGNGG